MTPLRVVQITRDVVYPCRGAHYTYPRVGTCDAPSPMAEEHTKEPAKRQRVEGKSSGAGTTLVQAERRLVRNVARHSGATRVEQTLMDLLPASLLTHLCTFLTLREFGAWARANRQMAVVPYSEFLFPHLTISMHQSPQWGRDLPDVGRVLQAIGRQTTRLDLHHVRTTALPWTLVDITPRLQSLHVYTSGYTHVDWSALFPLAMSSLPQLTDIHLEGREFATLNTSLVDAFHRFPKRATALRRLTIRMMLHPHRDPTNPLTHLPLLQNLPAGLVHLGLRLQLTPDTCPTVMKRCPNLVSIEWDATKGSVAPAASWTSVQGRAWTKSHVQDYRDEQPNALGPILLGFANPALARCDWNVSGITAHPSQLLPLGFWTTFLARLTDTCAHLHLPALCIATNEQTAVVQLLLQHLPRLSEFHAGRLTIDAKVMIEAYRQRWRPIADAKRSWFPPRLFEFHPDSPLSTPTSTRDLVKAVVDNGLSGAEYINAARPSSSWCTHWTVAEWAVVLGSQRTWEMITIKLSEDQFRHSARPLDDATMAWLATQCPALESLRLLLACQTSEATLVQLAQEAKKLTELELGCLASDNKHVADMAWQDLGHVTLATLKKLLASTSLTAIHLHHGVFTALTAQDCDELLTVAGHAHDRWSSYSTDRWSILIPRQVGQELQKRRPYVRLHDAITNAATYGTTPVRWSDNPVVLLKSGLMSP